MIHQVTLEITDEEFHSLENESQSTGKPIRAIVQEAFQQGRRQRTGYGQFRKFAGYFSSNVKDLSSNHDHYLGETAADQHGN